MRPADLLRLQPATFRQFSFNRQKIRAMRESSQAIRAGQMDLGNLAALDNGAAIKSLLQLRGVGRWTAEYTLLRVLGRLDVFPVGDVGARNRLAQWVSRRKPMSYAGVRRALRKRETYAGFIYFHMLLQGLTEVGVLAAKIGSSPAT